MPNTCTVTGTMYGPNAALLTSASFVRFRLRNYAGFVPRITGAAVIVETEVDVIPDSVTGAISTSIWRNDKITPDTTFYTIEFWSQGRITESGNYIFTSDTADLNTVSQIDTPPVPPGFRLVFETNGQVNGDQRLLNLHSSDSSVTLTDDGSGNINLQAQSGGSVTSVNGKTGVVVLAASDVGADVSGAAAAALVSAEAYTDAHTFDASKITTGTLALARGGTNADLSASGGATKILAQDASHVISARDLVAADIPSLAATYQVLSGKDAANGYAGLDASALLKAAEFPAFSGDVTKASGSLATTVKALQNNSVSASSPATNNVLAWNGSAWAPTALSPAQGSAAQVLSSGDGFMLSNDLQIQPLAGTFVNVQIQDGANANRVYCIKFTLQRQIKISHATVNNAGSGTGRTYSFAIFDSAGTTKLVDSGTFASSASGVALTNAFATVSLNPGNYWFAWTNSTATSTAVSGLAWNTSGTGVSQAAFLNTVSTYYGHGANAATSGAMPSSLGTITADTLLYASGGIPFVIWEP